MSDTTRKHYLGDARLAAEQLVRLLEPACERIEIAGSIRRRIALVGDIEIVCQPRIVLDSRALLAGEEVSALDGHVDRIIRSTKVDSPLSYNEQSPANGSKYKRLFFRGGSNPNDRYKVDVFAVIKPASWGALMAIRTGPADWSHLLVTKRSLGGAMPDQLQQANGALWARSGRIDTPTEGDYFAALGLDYLPPEDRTVSALRKMIAGRVAGVR